MGHYFLDLQYETGSEQIFTTESGCDHILKPESRCDHILKTESGSDLISTTGSDLISKPDSIKIPGNDKKNPDTTKTPGSETLAVVRISYCPLYGSSQPAWQLDPYQ